MPSTIPSAGCPGVPRRGPETDTSIAKIQAELDRLIRRASGAKASSEGGILTPDQKRQLSSALGKANAILAAAKFAAEPTEVA